jgi:hypothetical protein
VSGNIRPIHDNRIAVGKLKPFVRRSKVSEAENI